ncbi:MAG: hypothetical protein KA536_15970 [Saprospiraceae bacterium]|nr:hypothetical protein [Saprospiraceae bacterium]
MNDTLITFIITVLTASITAFLTYFGSIKMNFQNKVLELKREQTYKYFLPLKFSADELFFRLSHIEKRIVEKRDINLQLPQTLDNKDFEWYFTDWKDKEQKIANGYFLVSTIFMHALLYNKINLVLEEYPFIKVNIKKSLEDYINESSINDEQLKRSYKSATTDEHTKTWTNVEILASKRGKVEIEELIKAVRLSAIMKNGIPYGLQTAFGQFLDKIVNGKKEQINYEEFCHILMDKEKRIKFLPLYNFYSQLVDSNFNIDEKKLSKVRALMISLLMFRNAELK